MCGIAGIVRGSRGARRPRARRRHARRHELPRSRRRGPPRRCAGRPRPSPSQHHRPGRRTSAAVERDWRDLGHLQRRDLQPSRRARAARKLPVIPIAHGRDTETIVHAYEQWGDECVQRFRGMFAFAIWDVRRPPPAARARSPGRQAALLGARRRSAALRVRDQGDSRRAASSPRRPNHAVLSEVLATRGTAGVETMFEGIYKLLPGHRLIFEDGRVRTEQYWELPLDGPDPELDRVRRRRSSSTASANLLQESVRLRLMSDVPLGMFLSGGIDSSAIAALMAREIDRPVDTFSVAFADRRFSELEYARAVARAIGANAHEIVIDDNDFFAALPRADLARGRADCPPVERAAPFRLDARAPARRRWSSPAKGATSCWRDMASIRAPSSTGAQAASTSASCRRPFARRWPNRSCRGCPARRAATRADRSWRCRATVGDVPRQLRGHAAAASSASCSRPRRWPEATRTRRRSPTSRRSTARAASSDGCCTPTSRRTSSSC